MGGGRLRVDLLIGRAAVPAYQYSIILRREKYLGRSLDSLEVNLLTPPIKLPPPIKRPVIKATKLSSV